MHRASRTGVGHQIRPDILRRRQTRYQSCQCQHWQGFPFKFHFSFSFHRLSQLSHGGLADCSEAARDFARSLLSLCDPADSPTSFSLEARSALSVIAKSPACKIPAAFPRPRLLKSRKSKNNVGCPSIGENLISRDTSPQRCYEAQRCDQSWSFIVCRVENHCACAWLG